MITSQKSCFLSLFRNHCHIFQVFPSRVDHQHLILCVAHLLFQKQQPMSSEEISESFSSLECFYIACLLSWNLKRLAGRTSSMEDLGETFRQRTTLKTSGLSCCLKDPNSSLVISHCFLGFPKAFWLPKKT